jgi:hypothetical protein
VPRWIGVHREPVAAVTMSLDGYVTGPKDSVDAPMDIDGKAHSKRGVITHLAAAFPHVRGIVAGTGFQPV